MCITTATITFASFTAILMIGIGGITTTRYTIWTTSKHHFSLLLVLLSGQMYPYM